MPLFAVLFEDNPALAEEVRRRHMASHLDFLEHNSAAIYAAGPLRDAAEGAPAGGCGWWKPRIGLPWNSWFMRIRSGRQGCFGLFACLPGPRCLPVAPAESDPSGLISAQGWLQTQAAL